MLPSPVSAELLGECDVLRPWQGEDGSPTLATTIGWSVIEPTRLVAAGLAWRDEPPEPADAVALLEAEMVVLYLYYLDDHIARLGAVGREDLAAAFEEWRRRLVG